MSSNLHITVYKDELHRESVIQIWESVFGYEAAHNKPSLVIAKKMALADSLFFLAVRDKAVLGTVMAGYDGHRGWLYSLAVSSAHRKQGIGSMLIKHAEHALENLGCLKINLQIMEGNEAVVSFYRSLGYAVEQRISMGKRVNKNTI